MLRIKKFNLGKFDNIEKKLIEPKFFDFIPWISSRSNSPEKPNNIDYKTNNHNKVGL